MTTVLPDLSKLPLDDFEKVVLGGCLRVIEDKENPVRLNFFAAGVREIFSHLLHRLAPDEKVTACPWYRPEPNTKGPTRRQRAKYATQGGLADAFIKKAGIDVEDLHDAAIQAVEQLNKYTHIRPGVIEQDEAKIRAFVDDALAALKGLFESFDQCRFLVSEAIFDHIDQEVVAALVAETIQNLDELASHHSIEEVCVEKIKVAEVDHEAVSFAVSGSVSVELQWGSGSDVRRGDGHVADHSFPFSVTMWSPVGDVTDFQDVAHSVDTSEWWDGYYDED